MPNPRKTVEPTADQLTIEIGHWFKATASGRLAILALIVACLVVLSARALGWL